MKKNTLKGYVLKICFLALGAFILSAPNGFAQTTKLTLDLSKKGVKVSPMLYGLMTEEINYSYDGGLYAELIRNRIFKNNVNEPEAWSLVQEDTASHASIKLIAADPSKVANDEKKFSINSALTTCLRLTVEKAGKRAGIANEGYWGIPVKPSTTYKASFYMKGTGRSAARRFGQQQATTPDPAIIEDNTAGPITVTIESNDGKIVYATGTIQHEKNNYWKKYELTLTTAANIKPTSDARFVISTNRTGQYYFNLVSLFPPTYNNRDNGNRIDLTEMLKNMKPKFLRFPGGNYLEGPTLADAFPWKTTLGPIENRPGHTGSWGYRPTDGMGLYEFLMWCEEIGAEPLLGVYAGYALDGSHVDAGPLLKTYVDDAIDEIEYIIGDKNTYWGAKRVADGHPAPFKLTYVEIGNEDFFDGSNSYEGRFKQFREGIEKKYPQLICISSVAATQYPKMKMSGQQPAVGDEHYYRNSWDMWENASQYDSYARDGEKIFVGEWATREGTPTTNLNAALGDAAWMTGMERNSDIIIMSCYAPLFVNVNTDKLSGRKVWQWDSDLIGYDALSAYGSPSYYVQKIFSEYLGNVVVPMTAENIQTQARPAAPQRGNAVAAPAAPKMVPTIFYSATKDSKKGVIYLKVVNTLGVTQPVEINLKGVGKLMKDATLVVINSEKAEDTNSITDPKKIVPVTQKITNVSPKFIQKLAPYSVNVLELKTK